MDDPHVSQQPQQEIDGSEEDTGDYTWAGSPPRAPVPFGGAQAAWTKPDGQQAAASTDPETDETTHFKSSTYLTDDTGPGDHLPRPTRPRRKSDTIMIPNAGRMISALLPRQPGAADERKENYRRWLETKTREELIELILALDTQDHEQTASEQVMKVYDREMSHTDTAGFIPLGDLAYTRLPVARSAATDEASPTWRVVLVGLDQNSKPIGLLIDGEVTVGRAVGESVPDLDLTPFGAKTRGVSRVHALLRPSSEGLMLIDSDSSNGTYWNRHRIPTHTEQPLREGDVITFGRINFLVKMLKPPSVVNTRTLL